MGEYINVEDKPRPYNTIEKCGMILLTIFIATFLLSPMHAPYVMIFICIPIILILEKRYPDQV